MRIPCHRGSVVACSSNVVRLLPKTRNGAAKLPLVFAIQMIVAASVSAEIAQPKVIVATDLAKRVPDLLSAGLAELHPVPQNTFFKRHAVGFEARGTVAGVERRIYSNTEGKLFVVLGGGKLVADDITTTAPNGTLLSRYAFQVTGKADPEGQGGPYSVEFALYTQCPQSVVLADRPGLIIPGTAGTAGFPDDAPRRIEFVVPSEVTALLPTSFFLGVKLSRDNVGILMGAPAFEGHSDDNWDFPPFACLSFFGGFPEQPHASFGAEVFDREESGETHVEFKARRLSGPTFNPGADVWLVDDMELLTPNCEMVAYEVGINGPAHYDFEFRSSCDSDPIGGTTTSLNNSQDGTRLFRVLLNEPVALPQNPWFAIRVGNTVGGTVVAGTRPTIGDSADFFGVISPEGACELQNSGTGIHAALHLTVTCAGPASKGACCDMYILDGAGEAVCRHLAEINCPFPPRDSDLLPLWRDGEFCEADPFLFPCGVSACQKPDGICEDLTKNQCMAVEPLESPRTWELGRFCSFSIPATSEWGLVVLALLVLTAGTALARWRRAAA